MIVLSFNLSVGLTLWNREFIESLAASYETPHVLWSPRFITAFTKNPPLALISSQTNPFHALLFL
jgi:hypothetical protein